MGNLFTRSRRATNDGAVTFSAIDDAQPIVGVPVAEAQVLAPSPMPAPVQNPDADVLTLHVSSELEALASGASHSLLAMLSLRAPASCTETKRPPIDLVACIDRSGSMGGPKMRLMKQTLELLVKRAGLNAADRIALVTFDSQVTLALGLTAMDAAGRLQAEGVVSKLHPGSTTNLSGGALKAIDVLDASAPSRASALEEGKSKAAAEPGEEPQRTRAVMLFTDGLANEGIRDTAALVSAVNGALSAASAKLGAPISLFTFGFGADHNEDCLRALAVGSGASGLYYYVSKAEDIPNAFADCLGGLTSVVCQNASLSLSPAPGVSIKRVLNSAAYPRDAEGSLMLGDLFAEDAKDVLIELALPALAAPADSTPVLTASLRAFNVVRGAPDVCEATLAVARPEAAPSEQRPNTALDEQRNRIEAAEAMEAASKMADGGQVDGGRAMLAACRKRIAASSSQAAPLSLNLMQQCEELEAQYTSQAQYRAVGSKMSKMHAVSHARQRANHMQSADTYTSGASRKAAMKREWMSSLGRGSAGGDDSDSD